MSNFQENLLNNVRLFLVPLVGATNSPDELIQYLKNIGWHVDAVATPAQLSAFINAANNIAQSIRNAIALFESPPATWSDWKVATNYIAAISADVNALPQHIPQLPSPTELGEDIFQSLLNNFLNTHYTELYSFLNLFGVIERQTVIPITQGGILYREKGLVPYVNLSKLKNIVTSPKQELGNIFWPNGLATRSDADQAADRIFPILAALANDLGLGSQYDPDAEYDYSNQVVDDLASRMLTIEKYLSINPAGTVTSIGATIGLVSRDELQAEKLPADPAISGSDAAVSIVPFGTLSFTRAIGKWLATLTGSASIPGFQISLQGIKFLEPSQALTQGGLELDLLYVANEATPTGLRIGPATGTRVEITRVTAKAYLRFAGAAVDYGFYLNLPENNVVLLPGDGDGFLQKIFQGPKEIPFALALGWNNISGFYVGAAGGFEHKVLFNKQTTGFLEISEAVFGLRFTQDGTISVMAAGSGKVLLGPVELAINRTGIQATVAFTKGGNFGPVDLKLGFKLPSGVGIKIDSDAVQGGGYLYFDQDEGRYSGIAQLNIKNKINLKALGLLQTRLPGGRSGYSLLLLITAEFTPFQLGLGFTLNGIGGLIGINRTVNILSLRALVQGGRMDTLLFPPNVLGNPETAIATVENAFPAAEGRYVFGIMAKIGWGTPNLITLDAALIIELPAPVRLVLLGVLRAILPNEQTPILRLRADFLGVVDFGAKRIAFDASLVDSRILQFTLTGDAAFRLYQGENPVFLLTSGGFHPSFQPPANADLPTLRRLTLALANGNDFRLTLSSYVAITANTVQFGSRLDLFVDLPGPFTLVGFMGFDALFQFNPFRIAVQVAAGVAIKKGSRSVLSLYLRLAVTGPGPWHVDGEGSFKILFFKIKFRVNRTFGQGAAPQPLPSTDVRTLLLQALNDPKSWEVEQPVTRPASLVVLRAEPADATRLLVNPGGKLTVRQRVVPLAYRIERFGNTRPTTGNEFNITSASIGATDPIAVSGANLEEIRDHFSPGQFRQMSDAEKLSAPSFQTMRNGVRLGIVVEGLTGGASVIRTAQYELKIARNVAQGDVAGRPASSSNTQSAAQKDATTSDASAQIIQPTGPDPVVSTSVKVPMASQLSERLARNGAVGRTARSYEQRRPSRLAPDKVFWDEDTYAVVSTRNLLPHVNTPFPNEASATQALGDALRANPNLTGELQVIPSYQLPASVTASNLALA